MEDERALIRREAVQYVNEKGYPTTYNTFQKLASIGGGPVFRKFGHRVVYYPTDLDAWVTSKLSPPLRSTSEHEKAPSSDRETSGVA